MNIDFAIIRKEADIYRSHGLHKEALELYAKFVACSAPMDPGTKSSIEKQIRLIELEMNRSDAGAIPELQADRIGLIEKGWRESAVESDLLLCAQDQHQLSACNQRNEAGIEDFDWLDGMADVYALVSNDKDQLSAESLNVRTIFADTKTPKVLLSQGAPERKRFHRDYALKSFLKSIVAFVLVGSVFFYFVDWFSEVSRHKGGEIVQKTAAIVIKKMPILVGSEPLVSTLPDNEMEDQSSVLSKEKTVILNTNPAVDPIKTQRVVRNLSSPTNDDKMTDEAPGGDFQKDGTSYSDTPAVGNTDPRAAPEEPDPASVIDFVLKKRGL